MDLSFTQTELVFKIEEKTFLCLLPNLSRVRISFIYYLIY